MNRKHAQLTALMTAYNAGDPKRIQHFIKVFQLASVIGTLEQVDEETLFVLETAAIVHDIGIRICEQKYHMCDGKHQELEGPAEAENCWLQQATIRKNRSNASAGWWVITILIRISKE